jgi:hypothetical protein
MDNNLIVEQRSQYGSIVLYPVNDQAKHVTNLLRSKTISLQYVEVLKAMGFVFTVQSKTVKL